MGQPTIVLDTNVLLDIYSCHDLVGTFEALHTTAGNAAIEDPAVTYRLARTRESTILAMYLHEIGATTFSLHHEGIALMTRRVPPAPGGATLEADFTRVFVHFVRDYVLPSWTPAMPSEPGSEVGNAADAALIDYAKNGALPLITNEGYTAGGVVMQGMRKRAADAGVSVFAPHEFYGGKLVEAEAIDRFLRDFRQEAPRFLDARRAAFGDDKMGEVLSWVFGYYKMILLGEVADRQEPIRVTL